MGTEAPDPTPIINWGLLTRLAGKTHKHLNINAECSQYTCQHGHDHSPGTEEVLQEARTVQHLCDIAGVPEGDGYSAHVDARVFQLMTMYNQVAERLARIGDWHSREAWEGGLVGDHCRECGQMWPCDNRKMAEGTYVDPDETS